MPTTMQLTEPSLCAVTAWNGLLAMLGGIAAMSLAGCLSAPPKHFPAREALIGKTKQEILACAGQPLKESFEGDRARLIYYGEAEALEGSFPISKGSVPTVRHGCEAVLTLREDRIVEVHYVAIPESMGGYDHCEEIFRSCVP
jgi:hypothetical protein